MILRYQLQSLNTRKGGQMGLNLNCCQSLATELAFFSCSICIGQQTNQLIHLDLVYETCEKDSWSPLVGHKPPQSIRNQIHTRYLVLQNRIACGGLLNLIFQHLGREISARGNLVDRKIIFVVLLSLSG